MYTTRIAQITIAYKSFGSGPSKGLDFVFQQIRFILMIFFWLLPKKWTSVEKMDQCRKKWTSRVNTLRKKWTNTDFKAPSTRKYKPKYKLQTLTEREDCTLLALYGLIRC